MSKFTYDDIVRVSAIGGGKAGPARRAWIVGVFETDKELGLYWKKFPPGVVYTLEFEDGSSTEVHENDLVAWEDTSLDR